MIPIHHVQVPSGDGDPLLALLSAKEREGWALLRVVDLPFRQIAVFTYAVEGDS